MFQTKVVEEIKTHFLFSNPPFFFSFFENRALYEKMWKNIVQRGRPQITIWRMRFACSIPKATNTHSGCVILTAFQQRHWLHERASMLRYTYIGCLVLLSVGKIPGYVTVLTCSAVSLLIAALALTVVTVWRTLYIL